MSTKYLKITNKAGEVSRIHLEKLGLSTKRNDPNTIGQFGSGIKFAPIAALRNGWEWWFTGRDSKGEYKMRYSTAVEDGIDCIVYDYGDYQKSSSFTVDAGSLSWITPFQIYREAVANAFDESQNGDWSISVVDESKLHPVDGEFSVFITASPELMEVHNNFDKYFSNSRKVLLASNQCQIIEKIDSSMRIYCHNVLVHESTNAKSVFDYNINSIRLNEERNIASIWEVDWEICSKIVRLDDVSLIKRIIKASQNNYDDTDYNEIERLTSTHLQEGNINLAWFDAFVEMYGDNCVIYDALGLELGVESSIKLRGFNPVYIKSKNLFKLLSLAEVRTYQEILGEECSFISDYDLSKYPNVARAIEIASSFIPEINDLVASQKIGVFESELDRNLGLTTGCNGEKSKRKIFINKDHSHDMVESILATIVHEFDHYDTGISDSDYRFFRDAADRRIASLMMKFYQEKFYELRDGVLTFPMSQISRIGSNLSFSITKSEDFSVIKVGDRVFIANKDIAFDGGSDNLSGTLVVNSSADGFVIPSLASVEIVGVMNV
jgi:hypothetical protein